MHKFYFLMCSERSGSNLILHLLNAHPTICGPATRHIISPVVRNLFRYGDLSVEENWIALLSDISKLANSGFADWRSHFNIKILSEMSERKNPTELLQNIFIREARAHKKNNIFIKENKTYEYMPQLLHHFPESKFIFLVRDPRDVSLSWKKSKNHAGGVVTSAIQWKHEQMYHLKDFHLLYQMKRVHFLRYEDLLLCPKDTLVDVCNFMEIEYDDTLLNFYQDELTQKNAKKDGTWSNLSKPLMQKNANKYAAELSELEILAIEKICKNEMRYLGYPTLNSNKVLEALSEQQIDELNQYEKSNIPFERSQTAINNVNAKKVFYQHSSECPIDIRAILN